MPLNYNPHLKYTDGYSYKEGSYKLGMDIIGKKRDKSKEIRPSSPFRTDLRPDVWESTLHVSQSLRTKRMDEAFKVSPVYDNFSKNKYLDYYKDNLVATGNVDHIVPFKHSHK